MIQALIPGKLCSEVSCLSDVILVGEAFMLFIFVARTGCGRARPTENNHGAQRGRHVTHSQPVMWGARGLPALMFLE